MKAHSTTDFTTKQRKHLAKTGAAMKGGRYPIRNAQDLANAKQAIGRTPASGRPAVRAHIRSRAKALGLSTKGGSTTISVHSMKGSALVQGRKENLANKAAFASGSCDARENK